MKHRTPFKVQHQTICNICIFFIIIPLLGWSNIFFTTVVFQGGICDANTKQYSGYYKIDAPTKTDENYFYWMFESRDKPSTDPFILWLTGGPGCSGMLALLNENGPCSINSDIETQNNPYSWTEHANVLWIDQPTGVGFSYGDSGDYDHDEKGVRDDVYHFFVEFFAAHPEYANNDFYVFGESYGGHYAPNVAYRILEGNQAGVNPKINLKGLAVGNGLTDPAIQYTKYANMAYNNTYGVKAVTGPEYNAMLEEMPHCIKLINQCQNDTSVCATAQSLCNNGQLGPYESSGLNPYDVRIKCEIPGLCYNFTAATDFLNLASTRSALGVTAKSSDWTSCNMKVNSMFSNDWMKSQQYTIPPLLAAGVNVLIYAGDADFICNWMGNKAWYLGMDWVGQNVVNAAPDVDWKVNGKIAGKIRVPKFTTGGDFNFLQMHNAGHMVPMDQPENALAMVQDFLNGGFSQN
jgi:cathepsin A (carboxypeptidase C)